MVTLQVPNGVFTLDTEAVWPFCLFLRHDVDVANSSWSFSRPDWILMCIPVCESVPFLPFSGAVGAPQPDSNRLQATSSEVYTTCTNSTHTYISTLLYGAVARGPASNQSNEVKCWSLGQFLSEPPPPPPPPPVHQSHRRRRSSLYLSIPVCFGDAHTVYTTQYPKSRAFFCPGIRTG